MLIQPLLTRLDELRGEEFLRELVNSYPTLRAEIERLQEVERKYEEIRKSV